VAEARAVAITMFVCLEHDFYNNNNINNNNNNQVQLVTVKQKSSSTVWIAAARYIGGREFQDDWQDEENVRGVYVDQEWRQSVGVRNTWTSCDGSDR